MNIPSLNGNVGSSAAPSVQARPSAPVAGAPIAQPTQSAQQQPAPKNSQQLEQALEKLKTALPAKASALQFSVDEQSGDTIVRIVDGDTGDTIRQIPSKELLEIAKAIDKMQGLLLKQSA